MRDRMHRALVGAALGLATAWAIRAEQPPGPASRIAADEEVILFPTLGTLEGEGWRVRVHAWIYEPEEDSEWRRRAVRAFGDALGLTPEESSAAEFRARAHRFIADNERDKRLRVEIAGRVHVLAPSGSDGHARDDVLVPTGAGVPTPAESRWLEVSIRAGDDRVFRGSVLLASSEGLSIISDVDDTLRVSEVGDTARLLRRTLVEAPEAVPGMATLLTGLADGDVTVHYVTGTPWQLYPELAGFLHDAGFPRGTFHMRSFRFKDESALQIVGSPAGFKAGACRELFEALPGRRFVLVGDTSEDDAEVYAGLAAEYPAQVAYIAIRAVPGKPGDEARAREALRAVPAERWVVFGEAKEVEVRRARGE